MRIPLVFLDQDMDTTDAVLATEVATPRHQHTERLPLPLLIDHELKGRPLVLGSLLGGVGRGGGVHSSLLSCLRRLPGGGCGSP